jgi:ribonuclease BN (tRNA processing enzyme)
MTTCLALRAAELLVVFDAGTGLARLREPEFRRLVPQAGPVRVFLSHLHLDHTVGLSFLPALWQANETVLHVPVGPAAGEADATALIDRLVGPPFFPHTLGQQPHPVGVVGLEPGEVSVSGPGADLTVRMRAQRHAGGSLGFRVDDKLAFLTDTVYEEESAGFARGVSLLVHEAWSLGRDDPPELAAGLSSHTSALNAARVARDAGVGELLLSHLSPVAAESYYAEMLAAARTIFPATSLCEDGLARVL